MSSICMRWRRRHRAFASELRKSTVGNQLDPFEDNRPGGKGRAFAPGRFSKGPLANLDRRPWLVDRSYRIPAVLMEPGELSQRGSDVAVARKRLFQFRRWL